MTEIAFKRIAEDEARIIADGETVGDLYRHRDILNPGAVLFIVHLEDDTRGWVRIHERARIREAVEERLRSHPLRP